MEGLNPVIAIISKLAMYLVVFVGGMIAIGLIFSKIINKGFSLSEELEKRCRKGKTSILFGRP